MEIGKIVDKSTRYSFLFFSIDISSFFRLDDLFLAVKDGQLGFELFINLIKPEIIFALHKPVAWSEPSNTGKSVLDNGMVLFLDSIFFFIGDKT